MQENRKAHPLTDWLHITGLVILCGGLLLSAWLKSGQLAYPYPLDDSYIHLSIAESWAESGIPSPESSQPAFSTSSPLYSTILTVITWIAGPWIYWPLVIGLITGIGFVWTLIREFRKDSLQNQGIWIWTILILGPVPLLMILGMEHMLQCWIWAMVFFRLKSVLAGNKDSPLQLAILFFLTVSIRYEGVFLVAASGIVLIVSGYRKYALVTIGAGLLAFALPGIISTVNGGTFLPLSLLMKGHFPGLNVAEWARFGNEILTRLYEHPFMFPILTISAIGWAYYMVPKNLKQLSVVLQLGSWAHLMFAEIGGYRYEAWIIILHLVLFAFLLAPHLEKINKWLILATGWLALPLVVRTLFFTVNYPVSVQNIYDQSIQTGTFIKTYFEDESIAIQDIGAATYLADFNLTDLAGIGDQETNELFREQRFGPESVRELLESRDVTIAIIQQAWMGWVIPDSWIAVGCWTTPEAFIVPNAEVFFWAADSLIAKRLNLALQDYEASLPDRVIQSGPYKGTELPVAQPLP